MYSEDFKKNLSKLTVFPFILLLVISTSLMVQIFRQRRAAISVDETDRRISQVHHLVKLFIDMETGFRGYLLSNDEEFLEPYERALGAIESELVFLKHDKKLSIENLKRLEEIDHVLKNWLKYSTEIRQHHSMKPTQQYKDSEGKRLMDSLRQKIQSILDTEEGVRIYQSENWDRQLRITITIVYGLALLGAVLIAFFSRNLIKKMVATYDTSLEHIRREREQYRALFDGIRDYGISLLDADGKVLSWSAGAEKLTGFSAEEVIGKNVSAFYPDDDISRTQLTNALKQSQEEGSYETEEWRLKKDGQKFWAETVMTVLYHPSGELRGFSSIFRDYSKRRHYEEERTFLLKKLQEEVKARDEFITMASHELRTPITSLLLQVQNMEREAQKTPDEDFHRIKRRAVELFHRQALRLRELIDGIIDVARIHSGHLPFNFQGHDLSHLLRQVIHEYEERFQKADCPISSSIEDHLMASVDARRIEQVYSSLLDNALKYGCQGQTTIKLLRKDKVALFELKDFGPGIPKQYHEEIFERFGSIEGINDQRGLGLGLYLSRQIVEAHGGTIGVESVPGKGALFRVEIPLEGPGRT